MKLFDAVKEFTGYKAFSRKGNTVKVYCQILRQMCLALGNPHIEQLTEDYIMKYLFLLKELEYQTNTFTPIVMAIRKFLSFANKKRYSMIDPDYFEIPRREFNIPRVGDDDSYQKLLTVDPNDPNRFRVVRNRLIMHLLYDTGVRNSEMCSLNIEDVNVKEKTATIRTAKSQGAKPFRIIVWNDETNDLMKEWLEYRERYGGEALFISLGNQKVGGRLTNRGVGEMLRRYSNLAGLPEVKNAHSWRHAKAHRVLKHEAGTLADAANILGHSSYLSTRPYTWMFGEELKERAEKFLT